MSSKDKVNRFNLNPLVIQIEEVIKTGLDKILVDYMDRYELLEKTHKQIMQLPSIRQELNKDPYDSESDIEEYGIRFVANKNNNNLYMPKVESLEYRLEKLEKKYDTMVPILDKILNKIMSIDEDVKTLKSSENNSSVKPSNCKTDEKENIKIHFEEQSQEEHIEEETKESNDDDLHPTLITCSDITLNKVTPEEKEEEELDDDELSVGENKESNVEDKSEDNVEGNEDAVVEDESETENADNLDADVDAKTGSNVEDDVEDDVEEDDVEEDVEGDVEDDVEGDVEEDVEEEASIETETKSEAEAEAEEEQEEEEEVKQIIEKNPPTEEEEDYELFEIEIDDKTYCTNDEENGFIWELTEDGEQGEKIGYLKDGDAFFYEDEN